jgi:hypothetical protein
LLILAFCGRFDKSQKNSKKVNIFKEKSDSYRTYFYFLAKKGQKGITLKKKLNYGMSFYLAHKTAKQNN